MKHESLAIAGLASMFLASGACAPSSPMDDTVIDAARPRDSGASGNDAARPASDDGGSTDIDASLGDAGTDAGASDEDASVVDASTSDASTSDASVPETDGGPAGATLFADELTSRNRWQCTQGTWTVTDGVLIGEEREAQHHDASCTAPNLGVRDRPDFTRAVAEVRFRFHGDGISINLNHIAVPETAAHQHHHLVHVEINRTGRVRILSMKGWGGGRPIGVSTDTVGTGMMASFDSARWHVARITAYDDRVRVVVDGMVVVEGTVDTMPIAMPTPRNSINLSSNGPGMTAEFDYVRITRATARP